MSSIKVFFMFDSIAKYFDESTHTCRPQHFHFPIVLKAVLYKMMNKWQLCGGMERKCVEYCRKEVGSERLSRPKMVALTHLF
jgi:hypothetical protein